MDFWTWLETCPVRFEIDNLQGFDGVSVAFYPPGEEDEEDEDEYDETPHEFATPGSFTIEEGLKKDEEADE